MEKIVDLRDRIDRKKQRAQMAQDRLKLETVQRVIQCSSCHLRCAMCGLHMNETDNPQDPSLSLGYPLCESCGVEFNDFLAIKRGENSKVFWHNKEWVKMWSTWLNYRQAITAFMNSPEFKLLIE